MICDRWVTARVSRSVISLVKWNIIVLALISGISTANAATIVVPAGGDLQAAIKAAQCGDIVSVQAGASFTPFTLPNKPCTGTITIQTSAIASLPVGRVSPAQSSLMPKILAGNAQQAIKTEPGAHDYAIIGLEVAPINSTVTIYDLVRLGSTGTEQNTLSQVPQRIVLSQMYIHGLPNADSQEGIKLNSGETSITNCYISEIHGRGYDTQAILGYNGPGPYHIINNYLEAAGENILFGGADASITDLVPSNIEIRQNTFFKPLSWKKGDPSFVPLDTKGGTVPDHWTVKNLLELKNARNVVIDGNRFENCWVDAQSGYAILFTVRDQGGTNPWAIVENVTFTNNTVKNSYSGIQTLGDDYNHPSQRAHGLRIANNLFTEIGRWYLVLNGFYDTTVEHNTHFESDSLITMTGQISTGFIYRNNLTQRFPYGIYGDGKGEGNVGLNYWTPGAIVEGNIIAAAQASIYPTGNFYPATLAEVRLGTDYVLAADSPYKGRGSDGKDPGVDMVVLLAAQAGATPTPTPTPTPTATPTPTPTPTPTATPTPTPTPVPPSASVSYVQLDTATKGSWRNSYGADGHNTVNDSVNYPSYAQVSVAGYTSPTWMTSTTDVRGLQKAVAGDRIAARWDSSSSFTIDLNLTDGLIHRVAIYGLDWDGNNRSQRFDVLDAGTNVVMDTRTISTFNGGEYLVWNVSGHVKINVTKTGAKTAVVSGLYFGGPSVTPTPTPSPTPPPSPGAGKKVGHSRRTGQDLSNQIASLDGSSEAVGSNSFQLDASTLNQLQQFAAETQDAYATFDIERQTFPAASRIDPELNAAVGCAFQSYTSALLLDLGGTRTHLREAIDHLELSEVLINYGDIANPIDVSSYMVRQHYVDFLNREPDQSGSDFWVSQIENCGTNTDCVEVKRINNSAAFFLSIEFQQTGYLVERLYKAAYGDAIGTSNFGPTHRLPVPVIRFNEFLLDTQRIGRGVIIGQPGADLTLENNKRAFIAAFVLRARFLTAYPLSMSPAQFVDTLNGNAGGVLSQAERDQLVTDLSTGIKTRAQALRAVADDPDLVTAERNRAFVLAQYFGYMRRDPNNASDADYSGYDFWLTKLNQFGGNFVDAEMVKAFLVSSEYRHRFGQ